MYRQCATDEELKSYAIALIFQSFRAIMSNSYNFIPFSIYLFFNLFNLVELIGSTVLFCFLGFFSVAQFSFDFFPHFFFQKHDFFPHLHSKFQLPK